MAERKKSAAPSAAPSGQMKSDEAPPSETERESWVPESSTSSLAEHRSHRKARRRSRLSHEPAPGAAPGTLVPHPENMGASKLFLIDYDKEVFVERGIKDIDECIPYLTDERPSVTWVDVRGIGKDPKLFERIGEILKVHPLALEDIVNVPQRPKTDVFPDQQLIIGRMVKLEGEGVLKTEQIGILFGQNYVLTVQEDPDDDVLECVRERLRKNRGTIRSLGADYLAYAILDAVVDGFFPVLEKMGERLEDLEIEASLAKRGMSKAIHDTKRDLLTVRRAIWPQRDLVNSLLREGSPLIEKETRLYLRDTYDHAVQVMDMVETFREVASGLMDLYLSGVSNRMNEIMKVLTILSTIFLPITAIGGVYGMNFHHESSPYNMPELDWYYGYPMVLGLMSMSVLGLLIYYRKKGWINPISDDSK